MVSTLQRFQSAWQAYRNPKLLGRDNAEKSYIGGSYFGYSGAGVDMRPDETGVSQAYTLNVAVSKAIEFWELWLDGLKWEIRSESDDSVLIDSTMRHFPKQVVGSKLAHAIDYHEQCFKHSLFKSIAFSDWLHSETYIRFLSNDFGYPQALEWLNPLAVEPDILTGYIREYRYSSASEHLILKPKQVAYRIAKRNAQNDLRGTSRVLLAIEDLNIDANEKRSLKNYFKNGMLLGGLISPTDPNASLSPVQVMKLEDDLERKHKGTGNAHRFAIAPANMQIETFTPPDIEKAYSIIQPLRDTILMAMGVYPQLAGDPSQANFDSAYDIKRQWWEVSGIPYAKEIEGFINKLILPTLDPYSPCYFAFDFTPYEVEKPEVVSADFSAGIIDMYQAAELRGYEGDIELKGIYLINNVPMSKDIIKRLANSIPSQYALDYANAATAGQTPNVNADTAIGGVKPIETAETRDTSEITTHYLTNQKAELLDKPAYAYAPFPNNSEVLALQRELRKLYTDKAIEWQIPSTFHVTFCYAGVMSDEAISKVTSLISIEAMQFQPVQGNGIDVFETPDGKALHIRLAKNTVTDAMQANMYSAFMTEAYDLSEYSDPAKWNPHITLAYVPNEIKLDLTKLNSLFDWLDSVVIDANQVIIGRDDYDPIVVITAPAYKNHEHTHDLPAIVDTPDIEALDELQAWRKFYSNGKSLKRAFEQVALRGDIGDAIQAALETHDKQTILDAFKTAHDKLSVKAIQATRLDFEGDFTELLSRARSEKMGRVQWASAMRSILRRYGQRAYVDGLADGGVEDELTDDDRITINELVAAQSQYVTELGNVLYKGDGISDATAEIRAPIWYNKAIAPLYQAGLLSADANSLYEWAFGKTERRCKSCVRLNGQRHRLKGWKANVMPKSEELECGGWLCDCNLVKVKGRARGNY